MIQSENEHRKNGKSQKDVGQNSEMNPVVVRDTMTVSPVIEEEEDNEATNMRVQREQKQLRQREPQFPWNKLQGRVRWKTRLLQILESGHVTGLMTLATIYALYCDDFRILVFDEQSDQIFFIFSWIALCLFFLEIAVQCFCREDYLYLPNCGELKRKAREAQAVESWTEKVKAIFSVFSVGSFYFWLDLVATGSMLLEVLWFFSSSRDGDSSTDVTTFESARAGKASRAGARAARMIKVVRMIRLARLVRLYKYFSGEAKKKTEKRLRGSEFGREGKRTVATEDNEGESREGESVFDESRVPPESHVGAEMSDRTTKKVIVGILIMLVVIPALNVEELEYVNEFGMRMVFERWEPLMESSEMLLSGSTSFLEEKYNNWKFAEDYFLKETNCIELRYTDTRAEGMYIETFATIPPGRSLPESLRSMERSSLVLFGGTNDSLSISAEFDISARAEEEALLGMILTTFVIFLLAIGTMTFARDVNNLVIIPIEKMVQLVREIGANPLGKNFATDPEVVTKEMDEQMETTLLLRTISKIAGLMRVGFGEAGAEIIGRNLNMCSDQGEFNESPVLLGEGRKIQSIFAFCDVRNFTDTTECLQEEVMLFVNRIAHILHSIVVQCDGAANKNIGDAFLLTWKLDPSRLASCAEHGYSGDKALFALLKTMVEMTRYEEFICNFSPSALSSLYERMPGYKCRMGCGLHFGWAVEGAIGSDKKIDASYISPHVNWSEFLEGSTKDYGVPVLMSEPFFRLLSPHVTKYCRMVDVIKKSSGDDVTALYTYDANLDDFEISRVKHWAAARSLGGALGRNKIQDKDRHRSATVHGGRKSTALKSLSTRSVSMTSVARSASTRPRAETITSSFSCADNNPPKTKQSIGDIGEAPEILISPFSTDVWDGDVDLRRLRAHIDDSLRYTWALVMDAYVGGNWDLASSRARGVLQSTGGEDGPATHLLRRMEEYGYQPPKDWAGYRNLS